MAWYTDTDRDGYTGAEALRSCQQPYRGGPATDPTDCDDANATVFPGAADLPDDGIDQDCDGTDATAPDTDATTPETGEPRKEGASCGCASAGTTPAWATMGLLGAMALRRRALCPPGD